MMREVVAVDVGGTSVKSALVDRTDHNVSEMRDTPVDSLGEADGIVAALVGILAGAIQSAPGGVVAGIGLGFPGPFDYPNGICLIRGGSAEAGAISHAGSRAKFESIYGLNLRAALRAGLGWPELPIVFGNDASVALLGEARYGAGRGVRRLIGLTLGTGLGSAFLVDGQTVEGGPGVPPHGWLYSEPYQDAPADDSFSSRGLQARWQRAGARYENVPAAAEAARAGAAPARQAFEGFGADLGEFLQPYARQFGAEAVLILGGLAGAFDLFEQPLAAALGRPVAGSHLRQRAALLGAADLLIDSLGAGLAA